MQALLHSVPPALQQATADPRLHQRLLDSHGKVRVSLSWGHCSFLLGPGAHKVLFVPSKSLFPKSFVVLPHPGLLHSEPLPLWQATADPYLCRRHSITQRQVWLSLCGDPGS